jgi:hypothetical protein
LHHYLENLLTKKYIKGYAKAILVAFVCLSLTSVMAQSLFESLEQSHSADIKNYPKLLNKYLNKKFKLSSIKNIKAVKFHPYFLDNLYFNNENKILYFALRDECSMIDLIGTDLLYSSSGKLEYILIQFENQNGKLETHALRKDRYLQILGYAKCPSSKNLKQFFSTSNIRKTLNDERIVYPTSLSQCLFSHSEFLKNVKAPFLCDMAKKIKELPENGRKLKNLSRSDFRKFEKLRQEISAAKSYKKIIKPGPLEYLNTLCTHASNSENFCKDIFKVNYWTNAIKGLVDKKPLIYLCKNHLKKKKINLRELKNCAFQFTNNPALCHNLAISNHSLTPLPSCTQLSTALLSSRLYKNYNDCPSKVGNDSIVTISRILQHFDKVPFEDKISCEMKSIFPYAKFNEKFLENQFWQNEICFEDKLNKKKKCYPSLLGHMEGSELSLSKVMGKILAKQRGFNNKESSCKVIAESEYRPTLLAYKTGCFIIRNTKKCFGTKCDFKVMYDDLEFKNYTHKSNLWLDLLPYRYTQENSSFIKLIEKHYKKKIKEISNISSFNRIFKSQPNAVYMGVGCAEDLLPAFFHSKQLNKCSMLPFIVDGIIEDNGRYSMITRTSLDSIHAPRIIPWANIFASVKNYKRFQPLNLWSFYAIY